MNKIREVFDVDEIIIGNGGDYSVGIRADYSTVLLSDSLKDCLKQNGELENFKKELYELFKKYDDEVEEVKDDLDDIGDCVYEITSDMMYEEKLKRIDELTDKQNKKKKQGLELSKLRQIELYVLKQQVENEK